MKKFVFLLYLHASLINAALLSMNINKSENMEGADLISVCLDDERGTVSLTVISSMTYKVMMEIDLSNFETMMIEEVFRDLNKRKITFSFASGDDFVLPLVAVLPCVLQFHVYISERAVVDDNLKTDSTFNIVEVEKACVLDKVGANFLIELPNTIFSGANINEKNNKSEVCITF